MHALALVWKTWNASLVPALHLVLGSSVLVHQANTSFVGLLRLSLQSLLRREVGLDLAWFCVLGFTKLVLELKDILVRIFKLIVTYLYVLLISC